MKKRKIGLWIALAVVVVVAIPVILFAKQYYDNRYALDDVYYTVVPLDYNITPYVDEQGGRMKDYTLTGYNANGEARVLEFTVLIDAHGAYLYPPGTFVRVNVSKQLVLECRALDKTSVPEKALQMIEASFVPSTASTLDEYAAERTSQLASQNTPYLQVSCAVAGSTLVYTYQYQTDAQALAEEAGDLLDPVYLVQFRTDKQAFPELTAITLQIKLDDGTVIFSQNYDTRVTFNYEND